MEDGAGDGPCVTHAHSRSRLHATPPPAHTITVAGRAPRRPSPPSPDEPSSLAQALGNLKRLFFLNLISVSISC